MTISDKSIIEPEAPKPGIPIKKSTIAVIAGLIVTAAFVSALLMETGSSTPQATPATAAKKNATDPAHDTGSKVVIDEELAKAKKAVEDEERRAAIAEGKVPPPSKDGSAQQSGMKPVNDGNQSATGPASPLPPGVRRSNQDAALYEKTFAKGGQPAGAAGGVTGNQRGDTEYETDAQARSSRSMVLDDAAFASGGMMKTSAALDGMPTFQGVPTGAPRSMPEVTPVVGQSASAAAQQNLPRTLLNLQQAQSGAQGRPGAQAGTARDTSWLNEYSNAAGPTKTNDVIRSYPTSSRFTLHQGKTIPSVLGREINSDLPGEVTAYTTTDVYDSLGNGFLLIPKGSVLVGRYNSEIKMGQERVLFAFNRIILPNGNSFDLPGAQGQDIGGASGVVGDVNNHFLKMFGASFFTAWLADRATPSTQNPGYGGVQTTVSPAGQVLVDVSRTILDRNKIIQPTITVPKGTRINIEVKKDMEFAGPYDRSRN